MVAQSHTAGSQFSVHQVSEFLMFDIFIGSAVHRIQDFRVILTMPKRLLRPGCGCVYWRCNQSAFDLLTR